MRTGLVGRFAVAFRLVFPTWHDTGPVPRVGCQDAVISYQVEARRRHEGGQFLEQFVGGQQQVRRAV
jgi:hypothetical protein